MSAAPTNFRPALLIIDIQEDFCPPNGVIPVPDGRAVIPVANELLKLPFPLKVATKDNHPPNHVSFASNHPDAKPFTSTALLVNPANPDETYETTLWPDHCIVGSPGNDFAEGLDRDSLDRVILKGEEPRVEMYSAFRSPYRSPPLPSAVSELEDVLRKAGTTHVFVAGLAGEYCVMYSALDAVELGWETYIVEDGVRCAHGDEGWKTVRGVVERKGIKLVRTDSPEVEWVKFRSQ